MDDVVTWTTAATLLLGFGSGLLAGMFGIGGAVITTPSIRVLGATPIEAVGSTVPAILPGSISGAYRYWREGLVDWRVGLVCGLTGAVFAAGGAKLDDLIDGHYLMVLTAALLAFSGVSIIRTADVGAPRPLPATGPEGDQAEAIGPDHGRGVGPMDDDLEPHLGSGPAAGVAVLALVGAAAGLLAGLLGVGGGIVMMPAFTGVLRMPIKVAVGSSLVAVAIFSIPALITHTALGHIAWRFAVPLMIGVVPGAQVGARITVASTDRTMRLLFGTFILVLSVIYGASEIVALRQPTMVLSLAVAMALAYALTTGFHNAANANAALVITRVARPAQAVALASAFTVLGPLVGGAAVASSVSKIVTLDPTATVAVLGAALTGATVWNALTWKFGIPASAGHALIGGLIGAAVVQGGWDAIYWGGLDGWHPVGALGFLLALTISPVLGFVIGFVIDGALRRALRRATRRVERPIRGGEWATSASIAFANGSNDAAKSMGLIAALLLAAGHTSSLTIPLWARLTCGVALTAGTAVGGWSIVRTIGRRIYGIHPVDGLAAQGTSTAVVVASSLVGAPVSTSQVLASSVVGIGISRRRFRHVNWRIVSTIGLTWITTLPASAAIAAATLPLWRS